MAVVAIPSQLRAFAGGRRELEVAGATVRAALGELGQRHPELHRCVVDEVGAVRQHINLFVNIDHVRDRSGLETALGAADVLTILPAVSGG